MKPAFIQEQMRLTALPIVYLDSTSSSTASPTSSYR